MYWYLLFSDGGYGFFFILSAGGGGSWMGCWERNFIFAIVIASRYVFENCFFLSEAFSLSFCSKYHSLAMRIVLCKVSVGLILFIAVLYS